MVPIPQVPVTPELPGRKLPVVHDPRIYIGCPAYGSLTHVPFNVSLIQCLQTLKFIGDLQFFGGDSLVCRARNNIVSMFLNGKIAQDEKGNDYHQLYDWLFFVDTDIIFSPADLDLLYQLALSKGPGIYAGTYPLKTIRPKIVFNAIPGAQIGSDGVIPVREAGTGFMMIHRQVFEKMKAAYPQNDYVADNGDLGGPTATRHDWFQVGVKRDLAGNNPRYLSEDWYFCAKWMDMGGVILMQTKICANHIGTVSFPLNPNEIIAVADIYRQTIEAKQKVAAAG